MNESSLRSRARAGEHLIGALLRMPAEELVEMAALAGLDFILVDCEHGPADVTALRQHIAVAQTHGVPTLVRIGARDDGLALRALDQGASGIVAPHIDSVTDAEQLIAATHYPPLGHRGFATYSRAGDFGRVPADEHRRRMLEHTLVIGMIESPTGVAQIDGIAAVAGLDGVMIGPADLAAASGARDLALGEAIRRVHVSAERAGLLRMDIVSSTAAARDAFADGAGLVVYNLAHTLMEHLSHLSFEAR